jgi:hypothetical protein
MSDGSACLKDPEIREIFELEDFTRETMNALRDNSEAWDQAKRRLAVFLQRDSAFVEDFLITHEISTRCATRLCPTRDDQPEVATNPSDTTATGPSDTTQTGK